MMPPLLVSLLLASVLLPFGGAAHRKTEQGNRSYLEGAYEDALRLYTEAQVDRPQAAELYYDIGNVLFRQEDFEGAAEAYTRALLSAPDGLVGPAAFNLGNARYRLEEFDEAVKAYERALRSDPGDVDAKRNLELALRAQQQQQQPEPQQDPQDQQEGSEQPQPQPQPGDEGESDEQQPQQQGGGEPPEDRRDEGEAQPAPGEEPSPDEQEGQPGRMTPEQAERMLEGVEEEELDNLRKQALQKIERPARSRQEDW